MITFDNEDQLSSDIFIKNDHDLILNSFNTYARSKLLSFK